MSEKVINSYCDLDDEIRNITGKHSPYNLLANSGVFTMYVSESFSKKTNIEYIVGLALQLRYSFEYRKGDCLVGTERKGNIITAKAYLGGTILCAAYVYILSEDELKGHSAELHGFFTELCEILSAKNENEDTFFESQATRDAFSLMNKITRFLRDNKLHDKHRYIKIESVSYMNNSILKIEIKLRLEGPDKYGEYRMEIENNSPYNCFVSICHNEEILFKKEVRYRYE